MEVLIITNLFRIVGFKKKLTQSSTVGHGSKGIFLVKNVSSL